MKLEQLADLQPQVYATFQHILQNEKLAHAYLFSGGFASYEMAIYLSQSVFCENKQAGLPCGVCRSCRLIAQEEFSDVQVVAPQGNFIKTETVRELVKHFSQSGFETDKQVFIIRDAEKMHANAANSLLKVMEEPQSDIHLFLLTKHEEAVLATIKSRTQIVAFPKNTAYLDRQLEEAGLLKTQAQVLAQIAETKEQAVAFAANKAVLDSLQLAQKWVSQLLGGSAQAYLLTSQLARATADKAEQEVLFEMLTVLFSAHLQDKRARTCLDALQLAQQMWRSNVSLQNALEYMVLSLD